MFGYEFVQVHTKSSLNSKGSGPGIFHPPTLLSVSYKTGLMDPGNDCFLPQEKMDRMDKDELIHHLLSYLKTSPIETEVFVHGALCYSFSGMCLFSSYTGGRGANRGLCAQPCRREYDDKNSKKYLFNLKDNQLLEYIPKLTKMGISSLKIEGRMKSGEYTFRVGSAYRMALDDESKIEIDFEAAAEYYLDENFEQKIESGELLTFGDKYVLFELPFMSEPPNLDATIFSLQTNGYKPILAHPERYGFWYNDFNRYLEMKDKGVHLQLNILSLIGHYSPETKKISERLIDEGLISFLGSDCHNVGHQQLIEIARTKPYLHTLIESGSLLNHTL